MDGTLNVCTHVYIEHTYVYAQDTHTWMHRTHRRVCTEHTHTRVYTEHKHIYTLVYRHKEGEGDWGFAWILIFCYFLNSFFSLGFLCVALEPVLKLACGPGRSRTHRDPTTSASQVLGLKAFGLPPLLLKKWASISLCHLDGPETHHIEAVL